MTKEISKYLESEKLALLYCSSCSNRHDSLLTNLSIKTCSNLYYHITIFNNDDFLAFLLAKVCIFITLMESSESSLV